MLYERNLVKYKRINKFLTSNFIKNNELVFPKLTMSEHQSFNQSPKSPPMTSKSSISASRYRRSTLNAGFSIPLSSFAL